MSTNTNFSLWAACENYLEMGNNHYDITSISRDDPVVYKTQNPQSVGSKVAKVFSYLLIIPPIASLIISRTYRAIYSFDTLETKKNKIEGNQDCDVIATTDSKDTDEWRKRLIRVAEHNIVISGNYCQGKAFDELLQTIDMRMSEVKDLKVVIIGHPKYLQEIKHRGIRNHELLDKLNAKYKGRFSFVKSPDSFLGDKKITNHTKCTVIDYGRFFIQGGSGIQDTFASVGVLHDPKAVEIKKPTNQKLTKDDSDIAYFARSKSENLKFETGSVKANDDTSYQRLNKQEGVVAQSFIENFLPRVFRDQDFVFFSDGECKTGKRVYREALFLASKWDQHKKNHELSSESWDLNKLNEKDEIFKKYPALSSEGSFDDKSAKPIAPKSALEKLLAEKIPDKIDNPKIKSNLTEKFAHRKANNVMVKTFFTGPEDMHSDWEDNLVDRIEKAEKRIMIDQMYFQPSKRVMDALIDAGNRKVDITVVTACGGKHSPLGEKLFGNRNLYNLNYLATSVEKENRKNIHLYSYTQAKFGLHKKVVVLDDFVLAGSSNMGTKSLTLSSDHEMNFEAESKDLAENTVKIINEDKKRSTHLKKINLIFTNRVLAAYHSLGAGIWG